MSQLLKTILPAVPAFGGFSELSGLGGSWPLEDPPTEKEQCPTGTFGAKKSESRKVA